MRLEKCSFCSARCYPGHEICFVRNDAKIFRFCRSKCRKSFTKKKNPRKTRWTKTFRRLAGKELLADTTLELENRVTVPVRYSRELHAQAIEAIQKAESIRNERVKIFQLKRTKGAKKQELEMLQKNVERDIAFASEGEENARRKMEEAKLLN